MQFMSQSHYRDLLQTSDPPCVSILMPTHSSGADVRQDPIRYKNLLRRAQQMLQERGMPGGHAQRFLEPAHRLLVEDADIWRRLSKGLAVFTSPSIFEHYRLPIAMEELVIVGERFHLGPFLKLFRENGRFALLVLSANSIRLLQCTRHDCWELHLHQVPLSLQEYMSVYEMEKSLQFHTGTQPRSFSPRGAMFHSQGQINDEATRKHYLLDFFQHVDQAVCRALNGNRQPLVLAGVEYLQSIYRQASSYGNLLEHGPMGNFDRTDVDDIRRQAWDAVSPYFLQSRQPAINAYRQAEGTPLASDDLAAVVPSAYMGRVQTLLAPAGEHRWGVYDPATSRLELHERKQAGDEDLLDFAAVHTFLHGGAVHSVPREELGDVPLAAVFRRS